MIYAQDQLTLKRHSAKSIAALSEADKHLIKDNLVCPHCGGKVILRNGLINKAHFAHIQKDCGYFDYKGMSEWHLEWQSLFADNQREVRMKCDKTGEVHIADTVNHNGVVIEFQNSTISLEEKESRDKFYKKLMWVVNAYEFATRLKLEKVQNGFYRQLTWQINQLKIDLAKPVFNMGGDDFRFKYEVTAESIAGINNSFLHNDLRDIDLSEFKSDAENLLISLNLFKETLNKIEAKRRNHLKEKIDKMYLRRETEGYEKDYYNLDWSHPRKCWQYSKTPIFFDLNNGIMIGYYNGKAYKTTKDIFIKRYVTAPLKKLKLTLPKKVKPTLSY